MTTHEIINIIEMIDSEILLTDKMDCDMKHRIIAEKICYSLSKYPSSVLNDTIKILHITRETNAVNYPVFKHYLLF